TISRDPLLHFPLDRRQIGLRWRAEPLLVNDPTREKNEYNNEHQHSPALAQMEREHVLQLIFRRAIPASVTIFHHRALKLDRTLVLHVITVVLLVTIRLRLRFGGEDAVEEIDGGTSDRHLRGDHEDKR